jgi:small subunit ribosomal protein S4
MARYTGAKLKIIQRLGVLPGLTNKKLTITNSGGKAGMVKKKLTQYAIRLKEKQKLRFNYGLSEKQLINYVKKAKKIKGATGTILLQLLEMRIDNVVFRLGMAPTISAARQIVCHKHVSINNLCVSIPSYQCQPGDTLSVKKSSVSEKLIMKNLDLVGELNVPQNVDFDRKSLTAKIIGFIDREWIALEVNDLFVVEYYSRKL